MNKLNYEILSAIDNIETTVMESEMNVMNSIIDSYDKAVMILENCDDNVDTSSFEIFQESVIMEADDNNGNKKKKSVKEIIVDILLFIPRMIKKAYNFIKRKISKMNKPLSKEVVDKAKETVGDDVVTIKSELPITDADAGDIFGSSGHTNTDKPQVTVSTASHDTQKEEQIKSKIESVLPSYTKSSSPISFGNGNSGTAALSNVSPFKSGVSGGNSGTAALSDNKIEISVKISKDDILVYYTDFSDIVNNISTDCKKIGELFKTIDINRMGEPKYNQKFAKELNSINYHKSLEGTLNTSKYSEFVAYTNNVTASLNASISLLKNYGDTLEKSIMLYKNKNKIAKIPDNNIKGEAKDIIDSIKFMQRFINDINIVISSVLDGISNTTTIVNKSIEKII